MFKDKNALIFFLYQISDLLEETKHESSLDQQNKSEEQPQEGCAVSLPRPQEGCAVSLPHQDEGPRNGTENNGINIHEDMCSVKEARHAVLDFLVDVVTSQFTSLDVMRIQFFG